MTTTTPTSSPSNPSQPDTSTRENTSPHYSIQTNTSQEQDPRATRSKASHLGILIDGCGPASGRPEPALRAVDLARPTFMIVFMGRAVASC